MPTAADPAMLAVLAFTELKIADVIDKLHRFDDTNVNTRPEVAGANSAFALVTHCCGMTRRWSSTVCRGVTVPRDREAEFSAEGTVRQLLAAVEQTRSALRSDVLGGPDLPPLVPYAPPVAPPSATHGHEPWLSTNLGVLLHVFEEWCQHLGHLDLTTDLVIP